MNEIVVGVDGSEESRAALAWAVEEGRLRQAPVLAIHAWEVPMVPAPTGLVPPSVEVVGDLTELREDAADLWSRRWCGRSPATPRTSRSGRSRSRTSRSTRSSTAAERNDAQMIVVGSRGHGGLVSLLIGSTSDQVARHATCPVVIHRQRRV